MKGSREVKSDGGRQNQQKGGSLMCETGPLFPRLHVNETEKAGPRGPPRNKMALYEQFTIPSYRFVPSPVSSRPAVTSSHPQQYVPNEYRYSYLYYMPSTLPYANANIGAQAYSHLSIGVSSGSAVVQEVEPCKAPGQQIAEKSGHCGSAVSKSMATGRTGSNSKSMPGKQVKADNDSFVPTLSPHKDHGKAVRRPSPSSRKLCGSSITKSAVGSQEASIACEAVLVGPVSETQSCDSVGGKSADDNDTDLCAVTDERPGQGVQPSTGNHVDQQNDGHSAISSGQSFQQSVSSDAGEPPYFQAVFQGKPSNAQNREAAGTCAGECTSTMEDELNAVKETPCNAPEPSSLKEYQTKSSSSREDKDDLGCNEVQKTCTPMLKDNLRANAVILATQGRSYSVRNCERSGESENPGNGNCDISIPFQHGIGNRKGSEVGPLVSGKDTLRKIGQQQFWRARTAIIRQQQIFSDQVFELHKLIKVQRLLAGTPNVLIEDVFFGAAGVLPECNVDASRGGNAEKENRGLKKAQNPTSVLKEVAKGQSLGAGVPPSSSYPAWPKILNNDPKSKMSSAPLPSAPPFIPGGASAWGFPSVGVGQWMGPMAAQAGAYIYQPFIGGFPPGSAFGGTYGSAGLGPSSPIGARPMVSLGFPGGQRPQFPLDMHVGPRQWHSPMHHNSSLGPMGFQFSGPWYDMQHAYTDYKQGLAAGESCEVPSGSVASITNQPEASMYAMKPPCVSSVQLNSGMRDRIGKSGNKILDGNALDCAPSGAFCETADSNGHDEQGCAQSLDLTGAYCHTSVDYHDNDASLVGTKDLGSRAGRCPKRQKESGEGFVSSRELDNEMDVDLLSSYSMNALNLFPTGPLLSSVENCRGKPAGEAEEWQGRVIKVVPRAAVAAPESAAGILLSLQQERQQ